MHGGGDGVLGGGGSGCVCTGKILRSKWGVCTQCHAAKMMGMSWGVEE